MDEKNNLPPLQVALCLSGAGLVWVISSRLLPESLLHDSGMLIWDTIYKSLFVLVSGLIVYFQGRRTSRIRTEFKSRLNTVQQEKEILLQEIHHRVKNNLAVISGLIELQGFDISDRRVREVIEDSLRRIRSIASVHEGLYQCNSLSRVSSGEFIKKLVEQVREKNDTKEKPVSIQTEIDEMCININLAVPCALLLQEILANAYQHAFDGRRNELGVIFVGVRSEGEAVDLIVEDNGRGLPQGFDMDKADTVGSNLIRILVKQLKGRLHLDSRRGEGTRFHIRFQNRETKGSSAVMLDPEVLNRSAGGNLYSYS